MKRIIVLLIASVVVTAALITDIASNIHLANLDTAAAYQQGREGAIRDMLIYTVDMYTPTAPREFCVDGVCYDQIVYIELDGNVYTHGMY